MSLKNLGPQLAYGISHSENHFLLSELSAPARFPAAAPAIFTAPQSIARCFEAPRCAISSAKKIASEPRFLLRRKWVKMNVAAEFSAIPSSAVKSLANGDARFWCTQSEREFVWRSWSGFQGSESSLQGAATTSGRIVSELVRAFQRSVSPEEQKRIKEEQQNGTNLAH